jgi:hypothetical protein
MFRKGKKQDMIIEEAVVESFDPGPDWHHIVKLYEHALRHGRNGQWGEADNLAAKARKAADVAQS